jgi:hypothetical protein
MIREVRNRKFPQRLDLSTPRTANATTLLAHFKRCLDNPTEDETPSKTETQNTMPNQIRTVKPGPDERSVMTESGQVLTVPTQWALLPPGDAAATRRVKAAGPYWLVKAKRGRRVISLGVWANANTIATVSQGLAAERSTDAYAKKQTSAKARREKLQSQYVHQFESAICEFLDFHNRYEALAKDLSVAIARHATPVGSGTVARTKRIPVNQRAEAAVIAWLRHQTTGYDEMAIPRIKGKRREIRRMLATKSKMLLNVYRSGKTVDPDRCILKTALDKVQRSFNKNDRD